MKLTVMAAFAALAATGSTQAMIGNYPFTNDDTQAAGLNNLRIKAMGFTMGTDPYDLSSITLRLSSYDPSDFPVATIRDDVAGNPGAILHTLISPGSQGPGTFDYSFMVDGSFLFQANTVYWLTVGAPAGVSFDWEGSLPAVIPTGPGATHLGGRFTTNGGTSWTSSAIVNTYEVLGDPVPEPATLFAIGMGSMLFLALRRRR